MMRWVLLGGLVVAISATATVAVQWLPKAATTSPGEPPIPGPAAPSGPTGEATVVEGELAYDFGVMPQEDRGAHTWTIRNTGEGPLSIQVGNTSCSCTIANVEKGKDKVLAPGETTEIRLGWETKQWTAFSQTAEILTNDPKRPKIVFTIKGEVKPAISLVPLDAMTGEGLSFTNVSSDEPHSASFAMFSADRPELAIKSITVGNPALIETAVTPLDAETREKFSIPQAGLKVTVTLKPGTVLGDFQDQLVIDTDHPTKPEMRMPVGGRIVGPINVVPSSTRLTIRSRDGGGKTFMLFVRNRPDIHFEVVRAPEGLQIAIEPTNQVVKAADGTIKSRAYQMSVQVPPGQPAQVIDGTIVLKTDHPSASEVKVPVSFTVAGTN